MQTTQISVKWSIISLSSTSLWLSSQYWDNPVGSFLPWWCFYTIVRFAPDSHSLLFLSLFEKPYTTLVSSLKVQSLEADHGRNQSSCPSAENVLRYADTSTGKKMAPSPASSRFSTTPSFNWLPPPDAYICRRLGLGVYFTGCPYGASNSVYHLLALVCSGLALLPFSFLPLHSQNSHRLWAWASYFEQFPDYYNGEKLNHLWK